jgi:hypothetical protein
MKRKRRDSESGNIKPRVDVDGKTAERYRELARLQIIPNLGGTKLTALKAEQIGAWHATLIGRGLAPRTVRHARRLLSQMLKRAVDDKKLASNVCALRKPPTVKRAKIEVLEHVARTPGRATEIAAGVGPRWPTRPCVCHH